MRTSRFERFLPLTGALAGVLFIVMVVLTRDLPSVTDKDSGAQYRWLTDHQGLSMVSGFAAGYFCIAMLLFAVSLRSALRSGEPGESSYSGAAFAGGIGVALSVALMGWVGLAATEAADKGRQPVVQTLGFLEDFGWIPWVASTGVLLLAVGFGGLRTATLPRWLGIVTAILGVLCLLGPTGVAVYFALPFWLIITSVVLYSRSSSVAGGVVEDGRAYALQP